MLKQHKTYFKDGTTQVTPNVRLEGNELVVDPFDYVWEGVAGSIPELRMTLHSEPDKDLFFVSIVYQNANGDRQVVTDTGEAVVPPAGPPLDFVMHTQGWVRCFMVAQAYVPRGAVIDEASVNMDTVCFTQLPTEEG